MPKQIAGSIFDAEYIRLWQKSSRFATRGTRVIRTESANPRHFSGGTASHQGSKCRKCRKPLALLWNLDLRDGVIPDYAREGFAPADRLPFYVCWQCMAASYRVLSNDAIECFKLDRHSDLLGEDESPYEEAPHELPRNELTFKPIPYTIDALLSLEYIVGLENLDPAARKIIDEYYGREIRSTWDLPFSQFGGEPLVCQGRRQQVCPNRACPASRLRHPYGESQIPYLMKEL